MHPYCAVELNNIKLGCAQGEGKGMGAARDICSLQRVPPALLRGFRVLSAQQIHRRWGELVPRQHRDCVGLCWERAVTAVSPLSPCSGKRRRPLRGHGHQALWILQDWPFWGCYVIPFLSSIHLQLLCLFLLFS